MKKREMFGRILLVLVVVLSCVVFSKGSVLSAAESVVSIAAGASRDTATEIASNIYYAKEGTTIVLEEGFYVISNQAYLRENNIKIQGAGIDKTFVFVKSVNAGWGITVTGDACTVEGMTVERSTKPDNAAVIKVMGGNNAVIKNVKTIGGYYGVDLNPTIGTIINGCEFTMTSKASIGVGAAENKKSEVTIQNTITSNAGLKADIALNNNDSYGNSKVIIGKNNQFKNGYFYTENYLKSDYVVDNNNFPKYETYTFGNMKFYAEIPGIKMSTEELKLEVGKTSQLTAMVSPAYTSKDIVWSSSDTGVAKVDEKGNVIAISKGNATITATADKVSQSCIVSVFKMETDIPTIDTSKPTDIVDVGITDNESKEVINNTSANILNSIIQNQDISTDVISKTTLDNIKKAIEDGATITTKIESKTVEASKVAKVDLIKISDAIEQLASDNSAKINVAQYLDIGVILEAQNGSDNHELGNVYQLDQQIKFTVMIPNDMKVKDRKFYVLRIHNGETTILNTDINNDGTLSFGTDCFSTYALIYEDKVPVVIEKPKPIQPGESGDDLTNTPSYPPKVETPNVLPNITMPTKPSKDYVVKTNDILDMKQIIVILGLSFMCIVCICYKEKQD